MGGFSASPTPLTLLFRWLTNLPSSQEQPCWDTIPDTSKHLQSEWAKNRSDPHSSCKWELSKITEPPLQKRKKKTLGVLYDNNNSILCVFWHRMSDFFSSFKGLNIFLWKAICVVKSDWVTVDTEVLVTLTLVSYCRSINNQHSWSSACSFPGYEM